MRTVLRGLLAVVLLVSAGVAATPAAGQDPPRQNPMIFVHGGFGSGQQFEAQALRFASNGFPADHIEMFEHNSLDYPGSQVEVWARLDQMIADLLASTAADQVDLLGHSQGTGLVQGYLNSDPARAADVDRYVNLDGGSGGSVPPAVEALAIWGEGDQTRALPGATNVRFPDQAHTEVVNSPETFAEIHRFLTDTEATFTEVVREPAAAIEVSGRVQLFPQNTGAEGARLEIFEVDGTTGARLRGDPEAAFDLAGDGSWGPFAADGEAFYEFALTRTETDTTHHVYPQRFVRSNRWVRILTSEPDGLADSFWESGPGHTNMVILRSKEMWGDQGAASDSLTVNGTEILDEVTSPRANRTIGIFVHDEGVDGRSDLTAPVAPSGVPFLTGVDLFLPATSPPSSTIGVVTNPRRGVGPEAVCAPGWASATDRISVQLANYHRVLEPDGSPAPGHANPSCATAVPPPGETPDPGTTVAPPADVIAAPAAFTG